MKKIKKPYRRPHYFLHSSNRRVASRNDQSVNLIDPVKVKAFVQGLSIYQSHTIFKSIGIQYRN